MKFVLKFSVCLLATIFLAASAAARDEECIKNSYSLEQIKKALSAKTIEKIESQESDSKVKRCDSDIVVPAKLSEYVKYPTCGEYKTPLSEDVNLHVEYDYYPNTTDEDCNGNAQIADEKNPSIRYRSIVPVSVTYDLELGKDKEGYPTREARFNKTYFYDMRRGNFVKYSDYLDDSELHAIAKKAANQISSSKKFSGNKGKLEERIFQKINNDMEMSIDYDSDYYFSSDGKEPKWFYIGFQSDVLSEQSDPYKNFYKPLKPDSTGGYLVEDQDKYLIKITDPEINNKLSEYISFSLSIGGAPGGFVCTSYDGGCFTPVCGL